MKCGPLESQITAEGGNHVRLYAEQKTLVVVSVSHPSQGTHRCHPRCYVARSTWRNRQPRLFAAGYRQHTCRADASLRASREVKSAEPMYEM